MSTGTTYAVTGATGQLGTLVLERLVARYGPGQVVAMTRAPARLRSWAERGVDVREADFDDPAGLPAALTGVDRLLVITTTHESTGRRVAQHRAVIDAAVGAGVSHLALTSMPKLAPGHPSGAYAAEYLETEDLLAAATDRLGWTVLRNGPYAENLLPRLTAAVTAGRLVSNAGAGRAGYASRADYAVAAVAALAGPAARRRVLEVGGPGRTQADVAAIVSGLVGRPLPVLDVSDDGYPPAAREDGIAEPMPALLAAHHAAVRDGWFDVPDGGFAELVGRPAVPLEDVLAAHAEVLRAAAGRVAAG